MVNTANYHQQNFRLTQAMGDKLNAGDATFAPIGFDQIYLLVKAFPHPTISGGEPIQVPFCGGGMTYEQAPINTSFSAAPLAALVSAASSVDIGAPSP